MQDSDDEDGNEATKIPDPPIPFEIAAGCHEDHQGNCNCWMPKISRNRMRRMRKKVKAEEKMRFEKVVLETETGPVIGLKDKKRKVVYVEPDSKGGDSVAACDVEAATLDPPAGKGEANGHLNILITRGAEAVKAVGSNDEWEEIELGVDSGATETVVGPDMLPNIDTVEGDQKKRGVSYEIATGELIPILGEKRLLAMSEEEVMRHVTAQVADVNQALLSVRRMMSTGHQVVFDSEGSYILDKVTGECMNMRDDLSLIHI